MRLIRLGYAQSISGEGVRNELHLVPEGTIPGLQGRRAFEFVHIDRSHLAEPTVLDGYMYCFLHLAMQHADILVVEGPVSARAFRNAREFMQAWHRMYPDRYKVIDIRPDSVVDFPAGSVDGAGSRAIAAFSGGVDATSLALRHAAAHEDPSLHAVSDLVMVHGFDVALEDRDGFDRLVRRVEPLVSALQFDLHLVRTDIRRPDIQDWEHGHGAMLASVLHQFSDDFGHGLVASSYDYGHPVMGWGSSPATDHLLSGSKMTIVHEGAGFTRTEKVARIAADPMARKTVKVCWAGPEPDRNCGRCEKCVRTRLNFLAAGFSDPECFDTPFDPRMVSTLHVRTVGQLEDLRSIIDHADREEVRGEWVDMLRERIGQLLDDLNPPPSAEDPPLQGGFRLRRLSVPWRRRR